MIMCTITQNGEPVAAGAVAGAVGAGARGGPGAGQRADAGRGVWAVGPARRGAAERAAGPPQRPGAITGTHC